MIEGGLWLGQPLYPVLKPVFHVYYRGLRGVALLKHDCNYSTVAQAWGGKLSVEFFQFELFDVRLARGAKLVRNIQLQAVHTNNTQTPNHKTGSLNPFRIRSICSLMLARFTMSLTWQFHLRSFWTMTPSSLKTTTSFNSWLPMVILGDIILVRMKLKFITTHFFGFNFMLLFVVPNVQFIYTVLNCCGIIHFSTF